MLKFDSEHASIKGNFKKNKINLKNIIVAGMLVTSMLFYSGCAKTVDCDIKESHAHYYVNEDFLDKYIISEKEHIGNWYRTDNYINVTDDMEKLIEFENDEDLFRISFNKDKIDEITSEHTDYVEYRYKYTWLQAIPHFNYNGKTTTVWYTYIPQTGYSWTDNPNHSRLTGEQRVVHYVYYGYKVVKNEKGKYELVKSDMVDNLSELSDEYYYIKEDFYKKVHLDNKELEVDYEDGPEEDKKLTEEQQEEYEKQLEEEKQKSK